MMHWKNLYSVGSYFILKDSLSRDNGAMCQKTGKKVEIQNFQNCLLHDSLDLAIIHGTIDRFLA